MQRTPLSLALLMTATLAQAEPIRNVTLTEEDKTFQEVMEPVAFAAAYGDRSTGEHGTFGRFPAGFETPVHTHSHAYRAVVLKGEMTNPFAGQADAPVMRPGSFWSVAANAPHTTACVSDVPCEFFMYGADTFDFLTPD
ncbi:DUF4437 domain-containing protein [uncultured Tateyamaria sp.]|nr:DUF4437 domain-containing protein [uncultured Tateyamaria sp.]